MKTQDKLMFYGGMVVILLGFAPMWYVVVNPGRLGAEFVLLMLFLMFAGLWLVDHARFRDATRPVRVDAVINGLDGSDWGLKILILQGRLFALDNEYERVLTSTTGRQYRPDDLIQLRYIPVRQFGTSGPVIGARILGKVYTMADKRAM